MNYKEKFEIAKAVRDLKSKGYFALHSAVLSEKILIRYDDTTSHPKDVTAWTLGEVKAIVKTGSKPEDIQQIQAVKKLTGGYITKYSADA